MPWQEVGWGRGSCLLRNVHRSVWQHFRHRASFEWIRQKMPHGKDAASVLRSSHLPSASSTKDGCREAWERPEPLTRHRVGVLVQREGQRCGVARRARGRLPAGQARWRGGSQPPQECGMAAGLGSVFQRGAYICFSSGPANLCFFVVGGGGGEWGRIALLELLKTIRRQQGAGTKGLSFLEQNSVSSAAFLALSSCKTPRPAFCPLLGSQSFLDALWAGHTASRGVVSGLPPFGGLRFTSSAESDRWPSVLLTSGRSPWALLSAVAAKAVL